MRRTLLFLLPLVLTACGAVNPIVVPTVAPTTTPVPFLPTPMPPAATDTPVPLLPTPMPTLTQIQVPSTPTTPPQHMTPTLQPQSLKDPISSMSFIDDLHGWLAVDATILFTQDGGAHWTMQYTATAPIKLSFISPTRGWAIFGRRLFMTRDSGRTWHPTANGFDDIWWVRFGDAQTGWIYTKHGRFQTHDGGTTWRATRTPCGDEEPIGPLQVRSHTVWLLCPVLGIAGMRPNILYRSSNDGRQWQIICDYNLDHPQPDGLPASGYAADLSFITPKEGWVITDSYLYPGDGGHYGALVHSVDGGKTWQAVENTPPGEFVYLKFTSAQRGYLVAHTSVDNILYRTDDGGRAWQPLFQTGPGEPRTS